MNLDLNFSALTKLKDWWQQVKNNFSIIQSECNETRAIAENACTKEQAQAYVAEFAGSSAEYMAAIEAFAELYEENGASLGALEELVGARVPYTEIQNFDADDAAENGVYVCTSGTVNTPSESGVLISFSDALTTGFQLWFPETGGGIYRREGAGAWAKTDAAMDERVTELETAGAQAMQKSDVVFGTYTGNAPQYPEDDTVHSQTINLGFTPKAVIVCRHGYQMYFENGLRNGVGGGLALEGHPIDVEHSGWQPVEIVTNGFKVSTVISDSDDYAVANNYGDTYHFIAFKNGQIVEK